MKKTLLFFLLVTFSAFYSFSQGTKYGVRAGMNVSNMDFDPDATFSNQHRNGLMIGFFGEFGLSKSVAFAPELQFSSEGSKATDFRLDFIQIPAMFKFRLSEKFHLGLGPQAGIKVYEHEDGIKNFVYSGVGGIEFKLSHTLFLDARYTYGFTNVLEDDVPFEGKNTNIQFGFGYKF
ncbi:porin family protein [Aestuariivivens sediminis]|uniref:porin family protein n=1 Tax=Aestuariivivens sediminis TaxID=2913557 RepID=UPI001F55E21D|nr:porin family protein [Aestuariivivens sediminis]